MSYKTVKIMMSIKQSCHLLPNKYPIEPVLRDFLVSPCVHVSHTYADAFII